MGRKSTYTPEMAREICEWLSDGKTLADFCRQNGKPAYRTVRDWLDAHEDFAASYARARDLGHDIIAEGILEIVDERPPPTAHGATDAGYVSWQKSRAWTRMQLLAKWNPKKYGDSRHVELTGKDGGPIETKTTVLDPKTMDEDAREALRYALKAAVRVTSTDDQPYQDEDDE